MTDTDNLTGHGLSVGLASDSLTFAGLVSKNAQNVACRFVFDWNDRFTFDWQGHKLVCIAELWMFCTEDSIPPELAMLTQDGRSDGVEFVFDTQRPEKLNPSVVGAATEILCFRLDEKQALRAVAAMGHDAEAVKGQPFGSFVSRDLKGGELRGRVF